MRRLLVSISVVLAACGLIFAQGGRRPAAKGEGKLVNMTARVAYAIEFKDTTALCLVGGVVLFHNGAAITCDSAVQYDDQHMDFFGNVLINKDSTFIYGDRAEYDGERNTARVFSPLIKVVDGDATLYTYNFSFNTLDNVGEYSGGGVVYNGPNRLESKRGLYFADTRDVICVEQVQMRDSLYELTSDSVVYNLDTELARFFDATFIWNDKGEMLRSDRGEYVRREELYRLFLPGYILTRTQEVWADSLDYWRLSQDALLRGNIQIDDTEHKVLAFGDWGRYWGEREDALLTRRPSVISYDPEQGDSLYVRADSMFLFTIDSARERADSLARLAADSLARIASDSLRGPAADSTGASAPARLPADARAQREAPAASPLSPEGPAPQRGAGVDSLQSHSLQSDSAALVPGPQPVVDTLPAAPALPTDSLPAMAADSLRADSLAPQQLRKEAKERQREERRKVKEEKRREKERAVIEKRRAAARKRHERELAQQAADSAARAGRRQRRAAEEATPADSLAGGRIATDSAALSPGGIRTDSLAADSLSLEALRADSTAAPLDSIRRIVRAYRNVKAYRSDFQMVCDSLVALSADSTVHLYIDPVLWSQQSQITSDVMDIFTSGGEIVRAEFVGDPVMAQMVDSTRFNQIAGKTMTALFRDNEIYRHDVDGNVQGFYYMQDEETGEVQVFITIESGDMTFFIDQRRIENIVSRINPDWVGYPLDKIPESQPQRLPHFHWEGARRPSLADVFDRTVRPSQRAEFEALPHPSFPIAESIRNHIERLIRSGTWHDRTDTLSPAAEEFIRSRDQGL